MSPNNPLNDGSGQFYLILFRIESRGDLNYFQYRNELALNTLVSICGRGAF